MTFEEFISLKEISDETELLPLLKLTLVFMDGEEEESYKNVPCRFYKRYLKHEVRRFESTACFERGGDWYDCDEYFEIMLYAEEDDKDYGENIKNVHD